MVESKSEPESHVFELSGNRLPRLTGSGNDGEMAPAEVDEQGQDRLGDLMGKRRRSYEGRVLGLIGHLTTDAFLKYKQYG